MRRDAVLQKAPHDQLGVQLGVQQQLRWGHGWGQVPQDTPSGALAALCPDNCKVLAWCSICHHSRAELHCLQYTDSKATAADFVHTRRHALLPTAGQVPLFIQAFQHLT